MGCLKYVWALFEQLLVHVLYLYSQFVEVGLLQELIMVQTKRENKSDEIKQRTDDKVQQFHFTELCALSGSVTI